MPQLEVPVLIVGGGPVGLLSAILLAQQGIESRVVERRDGPLRAPAAHVVNPRSLEICRAAGIDFETLRAQASAPGDDIQVLFMTKLAGEEIGRIGFENDIPDLVRMSPTPLLNLSQNLFEPILLERLQKEGPADLHYRHQWEASQADADGVTSQIQDLASGETHEVRSRWLIAADGAGSRVRKSLGIEMQGPQKLQSFVMVHLGANLREVVRERPGVLYWIMDPDMRGVFVAHHIDHTWVYMHPWDPEKEPAERFTEEVCAGLVRRAMGRDDVDFTVRGMSTWTMTAQISEGYQRGRIFLAGDSAHRFPPTGGIGMNTGLADAHNLVWKLRAVADGWAPDSLLDSYEVERRPVAQENCQQSLRNAMKLAEVAQALGITDDPAASREQMQAALADPARRAKVGAAIENQREHFHMMGLHLGFCYEAGAVVPDGSAKPVGKSAVSDYVPTTRPGSRLPHVWLQRGGQRVSSLDLVPYDGFTLITGADGAAWAEAAASITRAPVQCVAIDGDAVRDADGAWARVAGIGPDGALLVRPDQHVAWRSPDAVPEPRGALEQALDAILGRG
jgi:2,4-dichlorophenol 6-monooxygenase